MQPSDEHKTPLTCALETAIDEFLTHIGDWKQAKLHPLLMPQIEQIIIKHIVTKCGNNISEAAKVLGISRTTIRKKLAN
jgi:Fis family transcriptional regulator, factor for inversion stimulation protein